MSETEEIPGEVMKEWINQCDCCSECSSVPCESVICGGLCDNACECEEDDDPDYMYNEII